MKNKLRSKKDGSATAPTAQSANPPRGQAADSSPEGLLLVLLNEQGRVWERLEFHPEMAARIHEAAVRLGITEQQLFVKAIKEKISTVEDLAGSPKLPLVEDGGCSQIRPASMVLNSPETIGMRHRIEALQSEVLAACGFIRALIKIMEAWCTCDDPQEDILIELLELYRKLELNSKFTELDDFWRALEQTDPVAIRGAA